jgi:hypothetical protein
MSDTNYKHLPLQSFAVGDTLRIFQSETSGQIFYAQNFTKEFDRYDDNFFVNEDEKIKFKHLMYGNKKYSLNKLMTADFKDNLNNTIEQDLQKETKKSLTYYDTDKFEFNQSDKRIFQIGKKCYILNYDSYVDEQNVKKFKKDNSYILTQYFKSDPNSDIPKQIWEANVLSKDLKSDFLSKYSEFKEGKTNLLDQTKACEFYSAYINNSINSYISSNYSASYFEDSKNANNKAIPIYDLNGDLLDKISVIKMHRSSPFPSVRKLNPKVPVEFENIIYKCCEKDTKKRYKNVNELRVDLLNAYEIYKKPINQKKGLFSKLFSKKG